MTISAIFSDIAAARCWLLELDVLSLAASSSGSGAFSDGAYGERTFSDDISGAAVGIVTLRYSTHGYTSHYADTPSNTWYDGRVMDPVVIDRRIVGKDGLMGLAQAYSELTLVNRDGGLDTLLTNYAIDGRKARVYLGRETDAFSAFELVFIGVISSAIIGQDTLRLKLSDGISRLQSRIVNATAYLGTGALEGGADLTGKSKPRGWGHVFGISPPLVDSAKLIYQVNNGAISDVTYCYDRGIILTKGADYASESDMNTTAPSAGNYRVWKTGGFFRLGSTPAGTVTCDALLDASGSGYINTVSEIVNRIVVDDVGLDSGTEIDATSFTQLLSDTPAEVGIWVDVNAVAASTVVESLLAGVGAFGGFSRIGEFSVGLIKVASETPVVLLSEENIVTITREPLPVSIEPFIWRVSVAYQKNYTVQSDLAAAVSAAQRTFAAQDIRVSVAEDATILSRHLLALPYYIEGKYAVEADAATEALRLFSMWSSSQRAVYRIITRPEAAVCDLGDALSVGHSRHGLMPARLASVFGHTIRGSQVEVLALC